MRATHSMQPSDKGSTGLGLCKANGWHIVLIGFNDRANLHLLYPLFIEVENPNPEILVGSVCSKGADQDSDPEQKSL